MVLVHIGIEIAIISIVLVVVARYLQIKYGNKKVVNAIQKEVKEKQNKIKELSKQDDPNAKKEADALQMEMMQDLSKMMSSNMRVMIVSMIIFIPGLALIGFLYNGMIVNSPIPLIVFHRGGDFFFWFEITAKSNWFSWYLWWSIGTSIVMSVVFKKLKVE
ncbi:DUF106 domain-containing protein [Candidatus Micrarchaeota archaeon]|nr:DUF106 domain-containing protein [Candidatus Micrarchaeota archaeon]MBU1930916.1 DUF106 domain-containing protein [Candidatus Micrarchaeota archaeon]